MVLVRKCDKCGKEIEMNGTERASLVVQEPNAVNVIEKDYCAACYEAKVKPHVHSVSSP